MTGNEFYDREWQHKIDNDICRIKEEENVDIIKAFNSYLIAKGIMISTRRNYLNKIVKFVNEIGKPLSELMFSDFINFITGYQGKTSSYQIQVYTALKNFSEYLYKTNIISEDYMKKVDHPKMRESIKTVERREKSYLNEKELESFILNAKYGNNKFEKKDSEYIRARDYALIMIMLNTGLRCSAIEKLDVSDISVEERMFKITEKRGKIRTCAISDQLMNVLEQWLEVRKYLEKDETDSALFISKNGTRLKSKMIRKIVGKCGEGIKDIKITPHKLRATYGTTIYEKTGDIYLTQKCMGHSNVQTTMLYVRGQEEKAQKKAAEIMSSITF